MRRRGLTFEIAALLSAKLVALTLIYYAFFAPSLQPSVDSHTTAVRLLDSHPRPN